jgi:hypothetical protein
MIAKVIVFAKLFQREYKSGHPIIVGIKREIGYPNLQKQLRIDL